MDPRGDLQIREIIGDEGESFSHTIPQGKAGGVNNMLSYDEELCLSPAGGWLFTIVYPKADNSLVLTHSLLYH